MMIGRSGALRPDSASDQVSRSDIARQHAPGPASRGPSIGRRKRTRSGNPQSEFHQDRPIRRWPNTAAGWPTPYARTRQLIFCPARYHLAVLPRFVPNQRHILCLTARAMSRGKPNLEWMKTLLGDLDRGTRAVDVPGPVADGVETAPASHPSPEGQSGSDEPALPIPKTSPD